MPKRRKKKEKKEHCIQLARKVDRGKQTINKENKELQGIMRREKNYCIQLVRRVNGDKTAIE